MLIFLGSLGVCSEAKGLLDLPKSNGVKIHPFPCGHIRTYSVDDEGLVSMLETKQYLTVGGSDVASQLVSTTAHDDHYANIRALLKKAVEKRLLADRRIGCLLSGGLDSSLVAALLVQTLKEKGCKYR